MAARSNPADQFSARNNTAPQIEPIEDLVVTPGGKVLFTANSSGLDATGTVRNTAMLIRLNPDGTPDLSLSGDGQVTLYDPDLHTSLGEFVLQQDGGVVAVMNAASAAGNAPVLVRFRADGALDESFGALGNA